MTAVLPRYAPLLLLAVAWEATSRLGIVSPAALPPLDKVASAWLNLAEGGDLWTNGVASISRAAAGLGLAIACGSAIGVLMAWYLPVRVVFNPIVQFFYPMPKSALIPVMVLWLGFGDASKIVLIFVGCMLPVTLSAFNGARGTEQVLIWSARSLGASRARVLWEVVVPSALPELLSGIRTALAFAFVLLVASELIVARSGFGYMIGWLGDGGVYDAMFAVVLTVALLGFAADRGYLMLMRRALAWREYGGESLVLPRPALAGLRLDLLAATVARRIGGLLPLIALVLGWEALSRSGIVSTFLLPPLSAVLQRVWEDALSGELTVNLGMTLYRALAGFAIAAVGGVALGILMTRNRFVRWFFDPIVSVGFPMPKIAFLPIFMLWLGLYDVSKITMAAFNAIFPVIVATIAAAEGVDRHLLWSARSLGASERHLLREIILPAALPEILTGLQIALPVSMIVTIVTEMLMGGQGLGGAMIAASRFADSPGVFAGIVEIAVAGLCLVKGIAVPRRHLLIWHQEAQEPTTV